MKTLGLFLFIAILCRLSHQVTNDKCAVTCPEQANTPNAMLFNNITCYYRFNETVLMRLQHESSAIRTYLTGLASVTPISNCVSKFTIHELDMIREDKPHYYPLSLHNPILMITYNTTSRPQLCDQYDDHQTIDIKTDICLLLDRRKNIRIINKISLDNYNHTAHEKEYNATIDIIKAAHEMQAHYKKLEGPSVILNETQYWLINHLEDSHLFDLQIAEEIDRVHTMYKKASEIFVEIQDSPYRSLRECAQVIHDKVNISSVRRLLSSIIIENNLDPKSSSDLADCLRHTLQRFVDYLEKTTRWYAFLKEFLNQMSDYEIQKRQRVIVDMYISLLNNVTSFSNEGIILDKTEFKTFLQQCLKSLYDNEYRNIKDVILDTNKINHLNNLISYTLGYTYMFKRDDRLTVMGRFFLLSDFYSITSWSVQMLVVDRLFIDVDVTEVKKSNLEVFPLCKTFKMVNVIDGEKRFGK